MSNYGNNWLIFNRKWKKYVKYLYDKGDIKSFNEFFSEIPKTVVAKDMRFKIDRFRKYVSSPERFSIENIFTMAFLFEIDQFIFLWLVFEQYRVNQKKY